MSWTKVLADNQTEGEAFTLGGGEFILAASGAATLQLQTPDGNWVTSDVALTEAGAKVFYAPASIELRVTGATAVEAWTVSAMSSKR